MLLDSFISHAFLFFMPQFLSISILLGCLAFTCLGQVSDVTVTHTNNSVSVASALYQSATTLSPHLYNGNRYHIYDSRSLDHQFFEIEEWAKGTIYYDQQRFDDVPLLYDIFKDQVVIQYQGHPGLIQLQSERVTAFSYINHRFIRIENNKAEGVNLSTGFYDVLYDGKTQVLAVASNSAKSRLRATK